MARYVDWGYGSVAMLDVKNTPGVKGICRYLSNSPGKNLTAAERDAALDLALDIVLVWETTAGRSTEGSAAGRLDGITAAQQAAVLGYPKGATIYAATDSDTTWAKVKPYQIAFNLAVAQAGYSGDIYGGYLVVAGAVLAGASVAPWQTSAWSYGKIEGAAALLQNDYHVPISSVDCDSSDVLGMVNGWQANIVHPAPAPSPGPAPVPTFPGETPMQIIRATGRTAAIIDSGGIAHPISSAKWSGAVHAGQKGLTVEVGTVSTVDYDSFIPSSAQSMKAGIYRSGDHADADVAATFGSGGKSHPMVYDHSQVDGIAVPDGKVGA